MTNEELMIEFQNGDDSALDKLYLKNQSFIRSIAVDVATSFNCYKKNEDSGKVTDYTKHILDELQCVGDLAFVSVLKNEKYDPVRGMLTTYLHPHIRGAMFRFMEENVGVISLSSTDMENIWKAQKMYYTEDKSYEEIAETLHIPIKNVISHISYNTHFMSIYEILPEDSDDDPFDIISADTNSVSPDIIVYRKICVELFKELFDSLLDKDKDILGHCYGVFGYKKKKLEFIALEERMKVDGVIKARKAAIERLQKKYPESKLYLWRKIYWTVMDEALHGPQ